MSTRQLLDKFKKIDVFLNLHQVWTAELEPKAAGTEEFQASRSAYY